MGELLGFLVPLGDQSTQLSVGKPERLSGADARVVPTIRSPYCGLDPILHASDAVRRMCAVAYMLTWAWSQQGRAARETIERGQEPRLVLLFDEIESHLHPHWQRVLLPRLMRAAEYFGSGQIIATTHSPLVLASVEPHFGDEDRLFHLNHADGGVCIEHLPWEKQGDAVGWLVSEVFGLGQARSVEAEQAICVAQALMRGDTDLPDGLDSAESIDAELNRVLGGHDHFWPRWVVWTEQDAARPGGVAPLIGSGLDLVRAHARLPRRVEQRVPAIVVDGDLRPQSAPPSLPAPARRECARGRSRLAARRP